MIDGMPGTGKCTFMTDEMPGTGKCTFMTDEMPGTRNYVYDRWDAKN